MVRRVCDGLVHWVAIENRKIEGERVEDPAAAGGGERLRERAGEMKKGARQGRREVGRDAIAGNCGSDRTSIMIRGDRCRCRVRSRSEEIGERDWERASTAFSFGFIERQRVES